MRLEFLPEASAEIEAQVDWYQERRSGLGDDLLAEIDRALSLILEMPETWPAWPHPRARHVRRFVLSRFPVSIGYVIRADAVFVVAVAHMKRNPTYWMKRLATLPPLPND